MASRGQLEAFGGQFGATEGQLGSSGDQLGASGSDCEACKGHLGASGGYFRTFGGQPRSVLPIKWKFDLRNAVSHLMRMKLKGTLSLNRHNLVIF